MRESYDKIFIVQTPPHFKARSEKYIRYTKGKQYEKDTVRLPREYMPQPDG